MISPRGIYFSNNDKLTKPSGSIGNSYRPIYWSGQYGSTGFSTCDVDLDGSKFDDIFNYYLATDSAVENYINTKGIRGRLIALDAIAGDPGMGSEIKRFNLYIKFQNYKDFTGFIITRYSVFGIILSSGTSLSSGTYAIAKIFGSSGNESLTCTTGYYGSTHQTWSFTSGSTWNGFHIIGWFNNANYYSSDSDNIYIAYAGT